MSEATSCQPVKRSLHPWELEAAMLVFGEGLDTARVHIHECASWTDALDRIGRKLKGMPAAETHNAVTLGNHCYFPIRLPDHPTGPQDPEHYLAAWLVHELTHCWQYQQMGWIYLYHALRAQVRGGASAYDFGHEEGLKKRSRDGGDIHSFNLEQQGDIARSYYTRRLRDQDTSAWEPYIQEIQKSRQSKDRRKARR